MRQRGRSVVPSGLLTAALVAAAPSFLLAQAAEGTRTAGGAHPAEGARAAEADDGRGGWGRDAWEFNGFVGLLNDEPEFEPDDREDQFRRDAIIGARVGYTFPFNAFVQLQAANSLVRAQAPAGPTRNVNSFFYELAAGYNVQLRHDLQVFPVAGIGLAVWNLGDPLESRSEPVLNYGLGVRHFLNRWLAARADVRMHQAMDGMRGYREQLGTPLEDDDLYALELSLGVSLFLGR